MGLAYQGNIVGNQFLSYEGTFTAVDGPASGMLSIDIGVEESGGTTQDESLQLGGTGSLYDEFAWQDALSATAGELNQNQSFGSFNPDPEPSNFPTAFSGLAIDFSAELTWIDATGDQLPAAYLILASDNDDISLPEDGTPIADDLDFSDGQGALNVDYNVMSALFSGLMSAQTYYFKIFPYTNSGQYIDFKTDGTPPSTNVDTPDLIVINSEDFEDQTLGSWMQYSVSGDQLWYADSFGGDNFAKMSGFSGQPNLNEDWLISPALNLNAYSNETFSFRTAMNYDGPALELKVSTDYDGTSDPNIAEWVDLTANFSPGGWEWAESGNIDLSSFNADEVHVAFVYYSTDSEAATWEVDDILLTGEDNVGIYDEMLFEFSIYPNPASDLIYVKTGDMDVDISIYNMCGAIVKEETKLSNDFSVDISGLQKGIYIVRLNFENSLHYQNIKIFKK